MFEINSVTLNDSESLTRLSKVKIDGEMQLVYSSYMESIVGFCLLIGSSSSEGVFSITCIQNQNVEVTTTEATASSRGHSSDTTSERTVSQMQQTEPQNDTNHNSETNTTLIAIIAGSIVGVAVIVAVIIAIVFCKRKRKPDYKQSTASHETGKVDDAVNGGQPNSAYENCGEVLQMHTSDNRDNYEELNRTNIDSISKKDYSKLHF